MHVLYAAWDRILDEPVLVSTLVGTAISLLVAFGVDISEEQKVAVIGFVVAVVALFARGSVTPTRKLED